MTDCKNTLKNFIPLAEIFIMIFLTVGPIEPAYSMIVYAVLFAVCLLSGNRKKTLVNGYQILICSLLVFSMLLDLRNINDSTPYSLSPLVILVPFLTGVLFSGRYDYKSFLHYYEDVAFFLAAISVLGMILLYFFPSVVMNFPQYDFYGRKSYSILFFNAIEDGWSGNLLFRNCGCAFEPGAFQIILNLGLVFLLKKEDKKSYRYYLHILVYCVAIVLTKSTTGLAIMILNLLIFLFRTKKGLPLKIILVVFIGGIAILSAESQIAKLFNGNIADRFGRSLYVIRNYWHCFLGIGATGYNKIYAVDPMVGSWDVYTNSLLKYGYVFVIVLVYGIVKTRKKDFCIMTTILLSLLTESVCGPIVVLLIYYAMEVEIKTAEYKTAEGREKMKVLWVCNLPSEDVYRYKNMPADVFGGWLSALSEKIKENVELVYCYPGGKKQDDFVYNNIHYYSFYTPCIFGYAVDKVTELEVKQITEIIEKEKPDILHLFGTEYRHGSVFFDAFGNKGHTVCSVQGIMSQCAKHYLDLVPSNIYFRWNISSLIRRTLFGQKRQMNERGKREDELLRRVSNVIGRTDFDKACTYCVNPERRYFYCGETLRTQFYGKEWNFEKCKKKSVFISQASSPLKGFNTLLEAVGLLKKEYNDIELTVAGTDFINADTLLSKLKRSVYGAYIARKIKKLNVKENIHFTGKLSSEEMAEELLKCNVYVLPSSSENSSNSLGEAMIMGVPVVASYVGGTSSLIDDNRTGLLYQGNEPVMLAFRIKQIFDDPMLASEMGKNAREKAITRYDAEANNEALLSVYRDVYSN